MHVKMKKIILILVVLIFIVGCVQQISEKPTEIVAVQDDFIPIEDSPVANKTQELLKRTNSSEEQPIESNFSQVPPPAEKFLTFEEKAWKQRIDAAFAPSACPPVAGPTFGGLYQGMLIDTHYHIANIPDSSPGENEDNLEDDFPVLGKNLKITDIVCTLKQENTTKIFAFFPVYPEIPRQMIEVAKKTMELYPDTFVPFIMPPDHDDKSSGSPTVTSAVLQEMLAIYPGMFQGYGEIGLYKREGGAAELPPDAQRLLDIYPVLREHKLVVYFHLGEGQKDNFEKILRQNPDLNFIWHGDQLISYEGGKQNLKVIEEIISNHPNVYYTIDELYGDEWMIRSEVTKEEFLAYLQNYETLLEEDISTWKGIIERHPDQFMWGTDRSDQVLWSHDPEVGQALANYARAFIGRLDPEVQEKFAYQNAERLLR